MSEHVHDCTSCNAYTVCSDDPCSLEQQTPCWACVRKERDAARTCHEVADAQFRREEIKRGELEFELRNLKDKCERRTRERDAARQQLQGQGTGLTAIQLLLGNPENGLIDAVKKVIAERDEARDAYTFRGGYIEDASGARWWSQELVAQLEARIDFMQSKIERLRDALETCATIGETRVANVAHKALHGKEP